MGYAVQIGDLHVTTGIRNAVSRVLESGRFTEGRETAAFERERAKQVGTRFAVAVNSGTSALIASLTALKYAGRYTQGAGERKKVITTPMTYAADANAIVLSGMEPIFVDVDPTTFEMRTDLAARYLEQHGSADVAVILPVHLMGYPADMPAIRELAGLYGVSVLEDAAQADGSDVHGKTAGSWGDLSISSFFVAHTVQAGEMGVVNTNDEDLFGLLRQIKANGRSCKCSICTRSKGACPQMSASESIIQRRDPRFRHEIVGYNFKTDEWTSAIAREQLARIDSIVWRRRVAFAAYSKRLAAHEGWLQLPPVVEGSSPFAYPIVIKPNTKVTRRQVCNALEHDGVETRPMYPCIPTRLQSFAHLLGTYEGKLPNAEYVSDNGFLVGCHQFVTDEDVEHVGRVLDEIAEGVSV